MKKILLAILFLSISGIAGAQDSDADDLGFRFGLQISPELTWMKSQDKFTSASIVKTGFAYGLMFDYDIAKNYSLSTGLYVAMTPASLLYNNPIKFNSQSKDSLFGIGTKANYKLNYIEIPISIKLKTNEIGYVTYFGQFGVEGGVNIKAKGTIKYPSPSTSAIEDNLNPDIGLFNVGLLLGAGVEYSLSSNTSAYTALNFVNGFIDITDNPKGYKSKVILNQLALRLGIFF